MKKNCNVTILGTVKEIKNRGLDFPTMITVNYTVDSIVYEITENIKLKSAPIKFGFLTIGQRQLPRMKNIRVGSSVMIKYNISNPKEAYIINNSGIMNC
jgi:hypothetical protein